MARIADPWLKVSTMHSDPPIVTTFSPAALLNPLPVMVIKVPPAVPPRNFPEDFATEFIEATKVASYVKAAENVWLSPPELTTTSQVPAFPAVNGSKSKSQVFIFILRHLELPASKKLSETKLKPRLEHIFRFFTYIN